MRAEGLEVVGVLGSMESEAAMRLLVDRAVESFGGIDLVVSTLGGAPYARSFDAISEDELLRHLRINTWPTLALIRAALSRGLADRGGSVVRSRAARHARRLRRWSPTRLPRPR